MNLRQILQQYGFLIYPLLVFGLPVLARVFKTLSEQSQKRRAEMNVNAVCWKRSAPVSPCPSRLR